MIRKPRVNYSESEKLRLLQEYYESGQSLRGFSKSHNLSGDSLLRNWSKKYGPSVQKSLSLHDIEPDDMANRSKDSYKEENAELKKRIAALEKALAYSKLETEARDILINRAEEYFNIPIRKKSGAKQ